MLNITSDFDFTPKHHKFSESPDLKLDNPEDLFDVERILEALDTRPDLQLRTPSPQEEIYISSQELRGEAQSQQHNLKTPSDLKFECSEPKTPPRTPVKRKALKVINPGKEFNDEGEVLIIKLKSSFNIPGILLYRDIATEFTVLRVLTKSCSIEDIAKELWKIFSNFGFPSKLQTEGKLYKLYPGNGVTMNHNPIMRPIYNRKTKDQVRLLINQWIVENLSNDLEMACHKVQWMINTSTVNYGPCPLYGVFLGKVGFVHENPEQDSFFRAVGYTSKRLSRNSFVDSDSDRSSND
uniref:Uncharacterized protein n=1 Tax=Megaselia scalaris TaxID=36166 RepID=T1GB84_MEGSC